MDNIRDALLKRLAPHLSVIVLLSLHDKRHLMIAMH